LIASASAAGGAELRDGQLVVIAHKAVSSAREPSFALADVQAGERARELAAARGGGGNARDPRAIQSSSTKSSEVLRAERGRG